MIAAASMTGRDYLRHRMNFSKPNKGENEASGMFAIGSQPNPGFAIVLEVVDIRGKR